MAKTRTQRRIDLQQQGAMVPADHDPTRRHTEIIRLSIEGHGEDIVAGALGISVYEVQQAFKWPTVKQQIREGRKLCRELLLEGLRDRVAGELGNNVNTLVEIRDGKNGDGEEVRTTAKDRIMAVRTMNEMVPGVTLDRRQPDEGKSIRISVEGITRLAIALERDPGPGQSLQPSMADREKRARKAVSMGEWSRVAAGQYFEEEERMQGEIDAEAAEKAYRRTKMEFEDPEKALDPEWDW